MQLKSFKEVVMKTTGKWSKVLLLGMFAMVLTFGVMLSGCATALPFQAAQTPVAQSELASATKSFKSSKWLGAAELAAKMQQEGMTEILFVEQEWLLGIWLTGIVYTGR
jgi:hypothetical protein